MTAASALKALADRRILACPVLTSPASSTDDIVGLQDHAERDVLGFVDTRDILLHVISLVDDSEAVKHASIEERLPMLQDAGTRLGATPLQELSDFACGDGNFVHSNQRRLSIWEVVYSSFLHPERKKARCKAGTRTSRVRHRIAMFNRQYQIVQIISQTDIAKYLLAGKETFKGSLDTKLMDIPGLCSRSVMTMNAGGSAFEALCMMREHDVSGVGIVDGDGRFLGNFSMSALRSILVEHLGALALPVVDFIFVSNELDGTSTEGALADGKQGALHASQLLAFARASSERRASVDGVQEATKDSAAALPRNATFKDMLEAIVKHRMHRVYIVDEECRPVAVVTLTDLMFAMAGEWPPGRPADGL